MSIHTKASKKNLTIIISGDKKKKKSKKEETSTRWKNLFVHFRNNFMTFVIYFWVETKNPNVFNRKEKYDI